MLFLLMEKCVYFSLIVTVIPHFIATNVACRGEHISGFTQAIYTVHVHVKLMNLLMYMYDYMCVHIHGHRMSSVVMQVLNLRKIKEVVRYRQGHG